MSQFFSDACDVKNELEGEYRALLGDERMQQFEETLGALAQYAPAASDAEPLPPL